MKLKRMRNPRTSSNTGNVQAAGMAGIGLVVVGLIVVMIVASAFVRFIPTGHVGVVTLFGQVQKDLTFAEGMHFMSNPFYSIEPISVRTETLTMQGAQAIKVISSDGSGLRMDITITSRLRSDFAPWVYQNLGGEREYFNKIIVPATREAVRRAGARYNAQEAYSVKRDEMGSLMESLLVERTKELLAEYKLEASPFELKLLLRNVELSEKLKAAIERKLSYEQESLAMSFVLEKEKKEAERKQIEAEGIKTFQQIVSEGIDDRLLRWKGIEATKELAESNNSKVVIIGGKDGMPLILNSK